MTLSTEQAEKTPQKIPTKQDAGSILKSALGKDAKTIKRFPTGLANYVYDVTTNDDHSLVVRLARIDLKSFFEGALFWYPKLKEKGVPLPELYYSEIDESIHGFPVMIMEKLQGEDLGEVYPNVSTQQKHAIADQIITIQKSVATLPQGKGYGYGLGYDDPSLRRSWSELLDHKLERARARIQQAGVVDSAVVDHVKQSLQSHSDYFSHVPSTPFMDDLTTKNVMISPDGVITGVIDADGITFGDSLFNLALTRMALLSKGYDTEYTDYWASKLQLSQVQQKALDLYTASFGVEFLSEMGHAFNKETADPIDQGQVARFADIIRRFS